MQLFFLGGKITGCTLRLLRKRTVQVDLGGVEPPSEQHILRHAKILLVNVKMISQNIRFKAISRLSETFSLLSWVANPLKL